MHAVMVQPAAPARRADILVVDDEPLLVRTFTRLLAPHHHVVGITSAREGLERIAAGEHFDVIFCDVMMPQMTGMDFYAELQNVSPNLAARVVFLSGGAFTHRTHEFLEQVQNPHVEKPVDCDALLALVQAMVR